MKNMERFNFCLVWVKVNGGLTEYTSSKERLFLIVGNDNNRFYGFLSTCRIDEQVYYLQNEFLELKIPSHNPLMGEMSLVMLDRCYEIEKERVSSIFYHLNYEQLLNLLKRISVNKNRENLPYFIKEGLHSLQLPYKQGDVILSKDKMYYVESLLDDYVACYKMSTLPADNALEVTMDYKKWFIDLTSTYFIKQEEIKYHNYLYPIHRLQVESGLRKSKKNAINKKIPTSIHDLWLGSLFAYSKDQEKHMGIILNRDSLGTHIITRMENSTFINGTHLCIPLTENIECDFRCLTSDQKVRYLKNQDYNRV